MLTLNTHQWTKAVLWNRKPCICSTVDDSYSRYMTGTSTGIIVFNFSLIDSIHGDFNRFNIKLFEKEHKIAGRILLNGCPSQAALQKQTIILFQSNGKPNNKTLFHFSIITHYHKSFPATINNNISKQMVMIPSAIVKAEKQFQCKCVRALSLRTYL